MLILCADTETGGTSPENHSLLQIGVVAGNLETGEILGSFENYLKLQSIDDYKIDPESQEMHGIDAKICFEQGLFKEQIAEKFADLYYKNNCVLLGGHNFVSFDVPFIAKKIFDFNPEDLYANFTYRCLDSQPIIRLFAGVEDMKQAATLKQTVKSLGISIDDLAGKGYHSALFDAILSFKILHKFRRVLSTPSVIKLITGNT